MTTIINKGEARIDYRGAKEVEGDRNNPSCYGLYCSCEAFLGSLATLAANHDGMRSVLCPCGMVTVVDKRPAILTHVPFERVQKVVGQ